MSCSDGIFFWWNTFRLTPHANEGNRSIYPGASACVLFMSMRSVEIRDRLCVVEAGSLEMRFLTRCKVDVDRYFSLGMR